MASGGASKQTKEKLLKSLEQVTDLFREQNDVWFKNFGWKVWESRLELFKAVQDLISLCYNICDRLSEDLEDCINSGSEDKLRAMLDKLNTPAMQQVVDEMPDTDICEPSDYGYDGPTKSDMPRCVSLLKDLATRLMPIVHQLKVLQEGQGSSSAD